MTTARRTHLEHDWYAAGIPTNIVVGDDVYIETSYSFAAFHSEQDPGLVLGTASGIYDRSALIVGPAGVVRIGSYSCLNATYIQCHARVEIGAHCLLAWGVYITDSAPRPGVSVAERRRTLLAAASHRDRWLPAVSAPAPVVIDDNVWIGFDTVVLPGVRIGRGAVVGCRSVVTRDIPPYAVAVGNPAAVVRFLDQDDTLAGHVEAGRTLR